MKYFRNDVDGSTIQQAVWRPTGTQLGKKKSTKDTNKTKRNVSNKKKLASRKTRAKDVFIGDGAPAESLKSTAVVQQNFTYPQENVHQQPNNEISSQSLQPPQVIFANHLDLAQQPQVYHHQNWPLDLVQSNHYSQVRKFVFLYFIILFNLKKKNILESTIKSAFTTYAYTSRTSFTI